VLLHLDIDSFFWDVTHRRLVITDVSGQPIGSIFKSIVSKKKMAPIGCREMLVTEYQSTLRNIPEELKYSLHRGGSRIHVIIE
jgi:hypothetical protein